MAERDAAPARRRAIVVAEYPDVCLAPTRPTPFQTVAYLSDAVEVSPNVRVHGFPATTMRTHVPVIHGSPPFKGIKSGAANGPCYPLRNASPTVCVNGARTVRDGTVFGINCASPGGQINTHGRVVYVLGNGQAVIDDDGSIEGSMSPPLQLDLRSPDALLKWSRDVGQAGGKALREMAGWAQEVNESTQLTTRALGTAQAVGGGVEAFVGGSCVYYSAGIGALLGCGTLGLHGVDNAQAGARTAWTGQSVSTFTHEIVRGAALNAGYSETVSGAMGTTVDIGLGVLTPSAAARLGRLLQAQAAKREAAAAALSNGVKIGPRPTLEEIAQKTEGRYLNRRFGTCAPAAMENAIRAAKQGHRVDIVTIVVKDSRHAVAMVHTADGPRFLSEGRVFESLYDMYPGGQFHFVETVDPLDDFIVFSGVRYRTPPDVWDRFFNAITTFPR
jgi:hypothetical protein